jgi:predicted metal-binding membrane protein
MTLETATVQPLLGWARQLRRRHPEHGVVLAAAAAWVAMGLSRADSPHAHPGAPVVGLVPLLWWTIMCVAMMVPSTLPAVRHVASNSLRWRRQRAITWFVTAYVSVWVAFGSVTVPIVGVLQGHLRAGVIVAAALGVAALWHFLPYQGQFRRSCHRIVPLPPTGWRAAKGDLRFGLQHGVACLGVCWPLMLVAATVHRHNPLWMLALTVVVLTVKLPSLSPVARKTTGFVLATVAVAVLLHY